ncbi:allantoinase AllB [Paenibacillus spiritus]|uniref:Allantoinase n=1 Tax=Paenibacillus spiritus TaxID=2496557 RepID=A0A5J5GBI6_9BACL|nr:allantoinase AllB [Paenibacillus spiritus]KAA9005499.1 allantoinase AllB [Paenibacillus spiritus]
MKKRFDWVITGGLAVLPGGVRRLDIGTKDGIIAALEETLDPQEAENRLDAEGQYVFPGVIDAHVHFNEPSFGHWEGFSSGSAALAAGGCTTYADMPLNGNPPTVNLEALRLKNRLAEGNSAVDYMLWGGLVPGNLEELERLAEAGVAGFKAFISNPGGEGEGRFREVDDDTLYRGMETIASFGGLLALHAESEALTKTLSDAAVRAGRTGPLDFAASRPPEAELEAVARALLYSERTGCRLHFVHISTAAALELIGEAKRRGVDVTAETCPHYLILSEQDLLRLGPLAKCAPPLRSGEEQEKLWQALKDGLIDFIASDHSPCPPEMKLDPSLGFFEAWGGISGAQSSLELMFHEGVNRRKLPAALIASLLAEGPARRFGLSDRKGRIAVGLEADLAILDPGASYTLQPEHLLYRHKISPYVGMELSCRVTATLLRGQPVYTAADGLLRPGGGRRVRAGRGLRV